MTYDQQQPGTRERGTSERLRRLKWLAVLAPALFLLLLELFRQVVAPDFFHDLPGYLVLAGIVLVGTYIFAALVFTYIGRIQDRLREQNRELLALHEAGLAITSELDLGALLQQVVDQARELVGARYGALTLIDNQGETEMFLTSGLTEEQKRMIGSTPLRHGVLGIVVDQAQSLRLSDVASHPQSSGFPRHHPPMNSLLAVPILSHGGVVGSLYVSERLGPGDFDSSDQERLERFATQAAVAIENARLHRRVRALAIVEERERIAREMHDSLAQVLGYVNTKAQAVQQLLKDGRTERAEEHLNQLAGAARTAYTDVRENILGLRTTVEGERGLLAALVGYLELWQDQSGINVELEGPADPEALDHLSSLAEIQLLRVIQEALANVRKHAQATQARISLDVTDHMLETTIEDNGIGFDPETIGRPGFPQFGLKIMAERAGSIGGSLKIERNQPAGTRVVARVPLLVSVARERTAQT